MYDQLEEILVTSFHVPRADIAPDVTLTELELDSLDVVELAVAIQHQLHADVSEDELAELQKLELIAKVMQDRAARQS